QCVAPRPMMTSIVGQVAAPRLEVAVHPVGADSPDDLDPVVAQVGLAADQRDLAGPQPGERLDDAQALRRRELASLFSGVLGNAARILWHSSPPMRRSFAPLTLSAVLLALAPGCNERIP